jgi:predicted MFS family arabinose efflux permease
LPLYLAIVGVPHDAGPSQPGPVRGRGEREAVRAALRSPVFGGLALAFTLYYGAFTALTYHLYPLLLERGLSEVTVVTAIALIGPAQVAGRVLVWSLARDRPVRWIGIATVAALPASVLALLALPSSFLSTVVFALGYGAANGVMTIVRGLAVPEMVTKEAYGELNGILAVPGAIARAVAPVAAAAIWSATGSYDFVLIAALAVAVVSAASFCFAALHGPDPTTLPRVFR